jgi:hypothetical protein
MYIKQCAFELSARGGDEDRNFGVRRQITFGKFPFCPFSRLASNDNDHFMVGGKPMIINLKLIKHRPTSLEMMNSPVSAAAGAQKSTVVTILKQKQMDPT